MKRGIFGALAVGLVVACSSSSSGGGGSGASPAIVAGLDGRITALARSGSDLLAAVTGGGIVRVSTGGGTVSPYAPGASPIALAADDAHVAWAESVPGSNHMRVVVAPAADGAKAVTLADEAASVTAVAIDQGFVYWTSRPSGGDTSNVLRAPVAGGASTVVVAAVKPGTALLVDATEAYFVDEVSAAIVAVDKAGGPLRRVVDDVASIARVRALALHDKTLTFVVQDTGIAWVPKAGVPSTTLHALPCGVAALAADAAGTYLTCGTTLRKVDETSAAIDTVASAAPPSGSLDGFDGLVLDSSAAYVTFGKTILKVTR